MGHNRLYVLGAAISLLLSGGVQADKDESITLTDGLEDPAIQLHDTQDAAEEDSDLFLQRTTEQAPSAQ